MTFEEWLIDVNGQYIEVAGSANAKNQCVDLANDYIKRVLGLPIIEWTNACDFPSKAGNNFDWIPNDDISDVPEAGDMPVWSSKVGGGAGHIDVCIEKGNQTNFKGMDENWPVGTPAHVVTHTYSNVIGWLRPKTINMPDTDIQKALEILKQFQAVNQHSSLEGAIASAVGAYYDLGKAQEKIDSLEADSQKYMATINELTAKVLVEQKAATDCQAQLSLAQEFLETTEKQKNDNWMLYKNKNDEYNALLARTQDPLELIRLFIQLFKK